MNKVAIITGGSSGIGRAAASLLSEQGVTVYEFSRRDIPQDNVTHVFCDITDSKAVSEAVNKVIKDAVRIDILINNAGSGISGAVEFTDGKDVEFQVNALFMGMDRVTRACIPYLRESRGRIVNVSSAAAMLPVPFQAYYSAMKAAVNSYTLALANEVRRFGITACAVMPGDAKTGFTAARNNICAGDDIYGGAVSRSVSRMARDEENGIPAEKVATVIAKAATKKSVRPLYTVGFEYKIFCALSKILPSGVVNRLIGMLYAK